MTVDIIEGDCRDVLPTLADQSVHCIVTSPPYFGLRDYGVDGQMGLEPTPDKYLEGLVAVFREARRVLRDDGTFWLNMGDTYAGSWGARGRGAGTNAARPDLEAKHGVSAPNRNGFAPWGVKPKDRMMMPARLAIALQMDGWWLRDEIVWHKPNPMPISVVDRTTPAHEMLYMLTKSARYSYDLEAVKEAAVSTHASGNGFARPQQIARGGRGNAEQWQPTEKRQRRSVWSVPVKPFKEAHFATFPPDLIEPCVLAGCPEGGTVLDPFFGAGTTGLVCQRTGRNAIGIELNADYFDIAARRLGLLDEPVAEAAE